MKTSTKSLLTLAALGASALVIIAQDAQPDGNRPRRGPGGPGGPGGGGMRLPIVQTLDANNDGEISSEEIANASAALKKLDKNGDGKLTREEYLPARRPGQPGQPGQDNPPKPPTN